MTSISQERAALARVGRSLRTRQQAGFRFGNYDSSRPVTEPATRAFVHITVTNPSSYSSNDAHARGIEAIGIDRFPSTGLSYNRLIMPDGTAYEGQPIGRRGAHTLNDDQRSECGTSGCPGRGSSVTAPSWNLNVNARAYAICQNVQHSVSDAMLDSLARTIAADMLAGFVATGAKIHGHRCVSSKSCPGDKMWARMGELNTLVRRYVANGFGTKPTTPTPSTGNDDLTEEEMATLNEILAEVQGLRAVMDKRYEAETGRYQHLAGQNNVLITEMREGGNSDVNLEALAASVRAIEADVDDLQASHP